MAPAPDELTSGDLLRVALDLLEVADRRRSGAHLRRALSTAYYAMFHSLARVSADCLVGGSRARPDRAAWLHVYRVPNSLWQDPRERRERPGARLTRRVREEYRVYSDRNATMSAAQRRGSAGMHRRSNAAWVLPQAVEHRRARSQCLQSGAIAVRPANIQQFAVQFAALQNLRHRADYDPAAVLECAAARQSVESAAESIRLFEEASEAEQAAFAAWVLLATRRP